MRALDFPPGVSYNASEKRKTGRWREANLIRWNRETFEPVGGWASIAFPSEYGGTGIPFASVARAVHRWVGNDGTIYTAYLCEEHVYVYNSVADTFDDISPTPALSPPLSGGASYGGYGDGDYGDGDYGTPRLTYSKEVILTPSFTIGNWGEDLIVVTSPDGRLLRWQPSAPSTPLTIVPNAPENNRSFVVTPERHVILLGHSGNDYEFAWCDQEDIENWNFADVASKAGFLPIEPRAPIISAHRIGDRIAVFDTRQVGLINAVGLPFVYGYSRVSQIATPMNAASIVEIPDGLIWASNDGFWLFNGTNIQPIDCPVWDWVRESMDYTAAIYFSAMIQVAPLSEIWWFFPTQPLDYPDRYLLWNYKYNTWSMGKLSRTAGLNVHNSTESIMCSPDQKAWSHEVGRLFTGAPERAWVESDTLNFGDGYDMLTVKQILPEITGDASGVRFCMAKSQNPNSSADNTHSPKRTIRDNGFVDIRETARDLRLRIDDDGGEIWNLGIINVDAVGRGRR